MATIANCAVPQTSIACPTRIIAAPIKPSTMSSGGLITGGATALRGQTFYDAGPGEDLSRSARLRNTTTMVGGGIDPELGQFYNFVPASSRKNGFLRAEYELTPSWTVHGDVLYGKSENALPWPAFLHRPDRRLHAVRRQPLSAGLGGGADERPRGDQRAAVQPGNGPVQRRHTSTRSPWAASTWICPSRTAIPRPPRTRLEVGVDGKLGDWDRGRLLHAWRGRRTPT